MLARQQEETARQRHAATNPMSSGAAASLRNELAETREALRIAQADAQAHGRSAGASRLALDDADARLQSLRNMMAQIQSGI